MHIPKDALICRAYCGEGSESDDDTICSPASLQDTTLRLCQAVSHRLLHVGFCLHESRNEYECSNPP